MNKKAMTEAALAMMLIAIVSMGVIGLFVYKYSVRQTCENKIRLCETSVFLLAEYQKALGLGKVLLPAVPKIDCPICVPGSSDDIKGKTEQETIKEVAEHLRYCWRKTLGKDSRLGEEISGTTFCLVCSEFSVDKQIDRTDLLQYLKNTKILTGFGQGKTYYEYLEERAMLEAKEPLAPNTKYQVLFFSEPVLKTNLVFLVSNEQVPKLKCDIYHYQKE